MKNQKNTQRAFSLMEMMLGLVLLAAGIFGVFKLMGTTTASADIEQESKNFGSLASGIQGAFVSNGSFEGLTAAEVLDLNIPGVKSDGGGLISEFGGPIVIRPASVRQPNDAFDIVYHGLSDSHCVKLIKSAYPKSYQILVNEGSDLAGNISRPGVDVQFTMGSQEGRIANDSVLTQDTRCGAQAFKDNQGIIAFRIYTYQSAVGIEAPPSCVCIPREENQVLSCPAGYSGAINQKRSASCTGGTPSCPTEEWSPWSTTINTCTENAVCATPPCNNIVTPPPTPSCNPYLQKRNLDCPAGQSGVIEEQRAAQCPDPYGDHVFTAWVQTQNTCEDPGIPPTVCTTGVESRAAACPAGQGGSITERRQSTCPTPTGAPVWGAWTEVSNTCSTSCVTTGNCCAPGREERTNSGACQAGYYGSTTVEQERTSSCSSATATPVWGAWYDAQVNGSCTQCPANGSETTTRWVGVTEPCPSATLTSAGCWRTGPTPGDYFVAGDQANAMGCPLTDTACPFEIDTTLTHYRPWLSSDTWMPIKSINGGNCERYADSSFGSGSTGPAPGAGSGSRTFEAEESASRTVGYNCPAGTTSLPAPSYGAWSAWTRTGNTRNETNTCGVPPATCTIPANLMRSWQVNGELCASNSPNAPVTIADGGVYRWTDIVAGGVAGGVGQADFRCTAGAVSTVAEPGATCTSSSTECPSCPSGGFVQGQGCTAYDPLNDKCNVCGPTAPIWCTAPVEPPTSNVLVNCSASFRVGNPDADRQIIGHFAAAANDPSSYNVTWSGIPVGDPAHPAINFAALSPWTNPAPNELRVVALCPGDGQFGYRATSTDKVTGEVFRNDFTCRCTNLGF